MVRNPLFFKPIALLILERINKFIQEIGGNAGESKTVVPRMRRDQPKWNCTEKIISITER